jgi:hypothetical protein
MGCAIRRDIEICAVYFGFHKNSLKDAHVWAGKDALFNEKKDCCPDFVSYDGADDFTDRCIRRD